MSTAAQPRQAVVVTGASTGIGRTCAIELAKLGYHVIAGVHDENNRTAVDDIVGPNLQPVIMDLLSQASIDRAAAQIKEMLGELPLWGLVNNAGLVVSGPIEFIPLDDLRMQFEINVFGHIALTQALANEIRESRGRIINISSITSRFTSPFIGPYSASKAAFNALSDALRMEMRGSKVKVSVVEPGSIATPIWDKAILAGDQRMLRMPREALDIYAERMLAFRAMAKDTGDRGGSPMLVFNAVLHALTATKPKAHYVVGRDARLAQFLLSPLPHRLKDRVILKNLRKYVTLRQEARKARRSRKTSKSSS